MPSRHNLITISDAPFLNTISSSFHRHLNTSGCLCSCCACILAGALAAANPNPNRACIHAHASSQELWQLSGGVFNVDDVLQTMVLGLEEDLEERRLDLDERRLEAGV
jgi:hypothetical protein